MAGPNARRGGPNVSQFMKELNEAPALDASTDAGFSMDDENMSMFTNTEFFDFDLGQNTDFQPHSAKSDSSDSRTEAAPPAVEDFSNMDFISGDFNFADFGANYAPPAVPSFQETLGNLQPIQPSPPVVYGVPPHNGYGPPTPRDKRKGEASSPTRPVAYEEVGRVAAEEDKRRRNTAASARFRVKKKQKEQALEKSAKEMTEKVTALESRIQQLETENKWLKNIVLEKNGGNEAVLAKLLEDYHVRNQAAAKEGADAPEVDTPMSSEEREAADSTG